MRAALFLDRDGIVNVDKDYVYRIADFMWNQGIFDLTRAATARGYALVIVTNQSGIGRGYYSQDDFLTLTAHMTARFAAEGTPLAGVYHCPFHPLSQEDRYRHPDHPWRKPRPGMLLAAAADLELDLSASILIGDRNSDIEAAAAAGVPKRLLIGQARARDAPACLTFSTVVEAAIWMAAQPQSNENEAHSK